MRQYTPQTAFNKIWRHFVRDKKPRGATNDRCRYLTDKGHRCAVGIFIPKGRYRREMEGYSIGKLGLFNKETRWFMAAAMEAHDSATRRFLSAKRLRRLASDFNLTVPTC